MGFAFSSYIKRYMYALHLGDFDSWRQNLEKWLQNHLWCTLFQCTLAEKLLTAPSLGSDVPVYEKGHEEVGVRHVGGACGSFDYTLGRAV